MEGHMFYKKSTRPNFSGFLTQVELVLKNLHILIKFENYKILYKLLILAKKYDSRLIQARKVIFNENQNRHFLRQKCEFFHKIDTFWAKKCEKIHIFIGYY